MLELLLGLLLFLGVHSVRIYADDWRTAMIERIGPLAWKGAYAAASLLGFFLLIRGWGQVRLEPMVLWATPVALRHLASLLTLVAFIFFVAAYVPGNSIKARLRHPMVLGTKTWALAHLLANNTCPSGCSLVKRSTRPCVPRSMTTSPNVPVTRNSSLVPRTAPP